MDVGARYRDGRDLHRLVAALSRAGGHRLVDPGRGPAGDGAGRREPRAGDRRLHILCRADPAGGRDAWLRARDGPHSARYRGRDAGRRAGALRHRGVRGHGPALRAGVRDVRRLPARAPAPAALRGAARAGPGQRGRGGAGPAELRHAAAGDGDAGVHDAGVRLADDDRRGRAAVRRDDDLAERARRGGDACCRLRQGRCRRWWAGPGR